MTEEEIIQDLKELIAQGTDNYEHWIFRNQIKACNILKAHYQLFLTEIIMGEILEYEG